MSIKPLGDRVVLKATQKGNMTESGIYIPETANKEKPYIYEVISIWPWKEGIEMNIKAWDKVLCGQYSWDEIKYNEEEYKIVSNEYILAIVD